MVVEMKMVQDLNLLAVVGLVACWGAVALAWLAGAIYFESQAPAERTRARYVSPMWISTLAAVAAAVAVPQADWRSLTFYAPPVRILGLAILLAATGLTIWARLALGVMWSAAPTVKQEHKLRTGGPYAVTRHPIYTGLLGMMLGSLLLAGAGRWIVACSWSSRCASRNGSCWPSSPATTPATGGGYPSWYPACAWPASAGWPAVGRASSGMPAAGTVRYDGLHARRPLSESRYT